MAEQKRKKRGGSDTARERGLVGVVVHLTKDQYADLRAEAVRVGKPIKQTMLDVWLASRAGKPE